jgi:Flp pilus assembly protein TadG
LARKRFSCDNGNALVELALLMSLFGAPMLLGTAEVGFLVYDSIEATNAAHAGAMYGMISSTFAADSAGVRSAAQAEAPDIGSTLTVTPTIYYACSAAVDGTQYSSQSTANAACSGTSNHSLEFIQVATTATFASPIRVPGLPANLTIGGGSIMEVQE